MVAWANLVGTIVHTMRAAGMPNGLVHEFLDELDAANDFVLRGSERRFTLDIVGVLRGNVPGNDG
jgi:hypothetical protein